MLLDDGEVGAGVVINAAGPWSSMLAKSADLELPLRAVREQDAVWEVRSDRPLPNTPVSNPIEAVYMRPMGEGRWLFGRGYPKPYFDVDPNNFKETCDNDFVVDVYERWCKRIPPLEGSRLLHGYAALYDVTPDWIPFMGPRAGLEGYADASGGSGHAFKTGPILARELVDWAHRRRGAGRLPPVQPRPRGGGPDVQPVVRRQPGIGWSRHRSCCAGA